MSDRKISISIPKQDVSSLDLVSFPGEIVVIDTPEAADQAVEELSREAIVGFDTETRPSFRKGKTNNVALMQISTETKAYLFRLNKIGLVDSLLHFIENPDIIKVGLSIRDDFFVMHRSDEFEPQGFVELQSFVRDYCIVDCSLQRIYAIVFGGRISKSQRLSNWEAATLTKAQQTYAAIDAWACLRLYKYLLSGSFKPEDSAYILPEEGSQQQENQ